MDQTQINSANGARRLSLVIPVYNESGHLARFLEGIDALELPVEKELVIVNDCSTDTSGEIIKNFPFKSRVLSVTQPRNMGKGAAIRRGIEMATGSVIGIQDADFEYDIDDIEKLVTPIINGRADVVYGSRFRQSSSQVHRTFHYLVNRILTLASNALSGLYLTDMETCYKFFRADLIKGIHLESNRFGFEPEITAKIGKLKVRILEMPVSYFPRTYIEGKKITWRDGLAAIRHIIYYNVFSKKAFLPELPRNYVPGGRQWL